MLSAWNRLRHTVLFELVALLIMVPVSAWVVGVEMAHAGVLAILMSTIAMAWNFIWNYGFDALERWLGADRFARGVGTRILNAVGFEVGLGLITVPLVAYWFDLTLLAALMLDLGFMVCFLFYAFAFNWAYDRIFVIPSNSLERCPT